ncbi:hypothetical protein [Alteromonas gilva]|uniref:Uncharacterized protein n=1 Tax=Alteromonas gilva TaxID=2987522 RepID=A0ABT5KXQ3_9ALTE|nr:hypothetical protein [Alteromonas gilva]MDC8829559.1 hypothetical protein [Alteromonas gilva]
MRLKILAFCVSLFLISDTFGSVFDEMKPFTESVRAMLLAETNCVLADVELEAQYQGGESKVRGIELVESPTDSSSKVLSTWLKEPNIRDKRGRVQVNAYDIPNTELLEYSVKLLIPKPMTQLLSYNGDYDHFMVAEFWNDIGWGSDYPFRISVYLTKYEGKNTSSYRFQVKAETKENSQWENLIWSELNTDFNVPFDEWITLNYSLKEGSNTRGLFRLTVERNDIEHEVFLVRNWTHHPEDNKPSGITHFNPIKLYTSHHLIDFASSNGFKLNLLWDDLDFKC